MGGEALSNLSIEVRDGAGETTRVDLARTFNLFAVVRLTQPITQLHAIKPRREDAGDVAGCRP
ncbi:MAG TPA: hypothetical protein VGF28_13205 [Thermoanaerobaculia bacterium]